MKRLSLPAALAIALVFASAACAVDPDPNLPLATDAASTSDSAPGSDGAPTPSATLADGEAIRADSDAETTADAGTTATELSDASTIVDAATDLDATPDGAEASPTPCTATTAPACANGRREVYAVTCTVRRKDCAAPEVVTTSSATWTIDAYPIVRPAAELARTYGSVPATDTGVVMVTPTWRAIVGAGGTALRATGTVDGFVLSAVSPGAGYNERHALSLDRTAATLTSTSTYQSRGPCGGAALAITEKRCTGSRVP